MIFANRIIITGGTGYVSSALLDSIKTNSEIILIARSFDSSFKEQYSNCTFIESDLSEKNPWNELLEGGETIFHFASQTNIYQSNKDPYGDWLTNVKPIHDIALAAAEKAVSVNVVFTGSATQAGMTEHLPVDETYPDKPVTMYDFHKLEAEKLLQYYTEKGYLQSVTLRLPNIYGPGIASKNQNRGIINQIIRNGLDGIPIKAFGGGVYKRDFVFIDDLISALLLSAKNIKRLNGHYYIISSGRGVLLIDLFNTIQRLLKEHHDTHIEIQCVEEPEGMDMINKRNYVGDSSAFYSITNWEPNVSLDDGIALTIKHYSDE